MHAPVFYVAGNFIFRAYMLPYIFPLSPIGFISMLCMSCITAFFLVLCFATIGWLWCQEYKSAIAGAITISCVLLCVAGISGITTIVAQRIADKGWNIEFSPTGYDIPNAIDHASTTPGQITPVNGTKLEKSISERFAFTEDDASRLDSHDIASIKILSYEKDKNNLASKVFVEFTMRNKEKGIVQINSLGTLSLLSALESFKKVPSLHSDDKDKADAEDKTKNIKKDFENSIRAH